MNINQKDKTFIIKGGCPFCGRGTVFNPSEFVKEDGYQFWMINSSTLHCVEEPKEQSSSYNS